MQGLVPECVHVCVWDGWRGWGSAEYHGGMETDLIESVKHGLSVLSMDEQNRSSMERGSHSVRS